jgi:hypothetical protein
LFLETQLGPFKCSRAGLENHQDGGEHVHWFGEAKNNRHFSINDPRFLDWQGIHPEIRPVTKTPWLAAEYPLKEVTSDHPALWDEGSPPNTGKKDADDKWRYCLQATSRDDYMSRLAERCPKELQIHYNSLNTFAKDYFAPKMEHRESHDTTCHCESYPTLVDWVANQLRGGNRGRRLSLILYGNSRLGKTIWARSLGAHVYTGGMFMLDRINPAGTDAQYAVFDDIMDGFDGIPNWKYWFGCMDDFVCTDKYRAKLNIRWGKPSIMLCNENPTLELSPANQAWVAANCVVVNLTNYLLHVNNKEGVPIMDEHMPPCDLCAVSV